MKDMLFDIKKARKIWLRNGLLIPAPFHIIALIPILVEPVETFNNLLSSNRPSLILSVVCGLLFLFSMSFVKPLTLWVISTEKKVINFSATDISQTVTDMRMITCTFSLAFGILDVINHSSVLFAMSYVVAMFLHLTVHRPTEQKAKQVWDEFQHRLSRRNQA